MTLRRQLLIWLLGGTFVCTVLAAALMFARISTEANELFDNGLQQIARTWPAHSAPDGPAGPEIRDYRDFAVQIWSPAGILIYSSRPDLPLPLNRESGFGTAIVAGNAWRIYTEVRSTAAIQVAHLMRARERVIASMAFRSLGPLAGFVVLLSGFIWLVVGRSLRPLQRLADEVRTRSPEALQPLPAMGLPPEVRPIAAALNDLLLRLDRALSAQRAFVADAAHELRTPLTALKLQVQLLERSKNEAQRSAGLAKLNERLDRATRLVQQLLNLARSEPQESIGPRVAVSLTRIAQEVVAELMPLADAKHIDLGADTPEPPVMVQARADEVRVLMENLVDNAIRYTPEGGRVDVTVAVEEGRPCLRVTDTGPGIPAEERERVFERFHRRAGTGASGSGLGLAIAKNIADQHQATIRLSENPAARGLAVTVTF